MSILGGSFETFLVFLCISVELQHRDKIPQLRLITLYLSFGPQMRLQMRPLVEALDEAEIAPLDHNSA